MIAAWPRLAAALEGLDCALMGGTAVAMMLRHRHSVLQDRLAARNRDLPPGTFRITAAEMEEFASFFERPTPEELALGTED